MNVPNLLKNLLYKKQYFIVTGLIVLFSVIISRGITVSSPIIVIFPFLIFVAFWILLNWRVEYALWMLIIFCINVFGIFHGMSIPHLSLPGIGTFHLRDLVLLGMTIHAAHRLYSKKDRTFKRSPLAKPLLALLCIVLLNSIINIYQGINPQYLLRGWRYVAYYLIFSTFGIQLLEQKCSSNTLF
jgi:hypothetical protein